MPQTTSGADLAKVAFAVRAAELFGGGKVDFEEIDQKLRKLCLQWRHVPRIATIITTGVFLWGFLMKTTFGEIPLGINLLVSAVVWATIITVLGPPLFRIFMFPLFMRKLRNIQNKLERIGGRQSICLVVRIDYERKRLKKLANWFF